MRVETQLAPGVPPDYYRRIYEAEETHFWYRGMYAISVEFLGPKLRRDLRLLDAGCGTGGFLRFLLDNGQFSSAAGVDIASAAIEFAQLRVPGADLRVAPLHELPFAEHAFDVVVSNDVLQHVPEADVDSSLRELRRVLSAEGALVLRTNGSRRLRRERDDWRAYDVDTLRRVLEDAGFIVERVTHANAMLSLLGAIRGRIPHAPSDERHGIPTRPPSRLVSTIGGRALALESWWVGRGHAIPYGHTLFALAGRT